MGHYDLPTLLLSFYICSVACCPPGFTPWHQGYCYTTDTGFGDWNVVEMNCRAAGGDLASIHTALEQARIHNVHVTMGVENLWIGMICNIVPFWTDDTPVDYNNFEAPPTTCPYGSKYFMHPQDGLWYQFAYTGNAQGLCRHRKRNGERCSDYDEVEGTDICISVRNDAKTWNQAEAACRQESAHLISIHDKKTNDMIAKLIRNNEIADIVGGFHIGLTSTAGSKGEILNWTDGSDVNYTSYAPGFPSDAFGHCTAMETQPRPGPWITAQCDSSVLPYICSRPVNNPIQADGCPDKVHYKNYGTVFSPSYPASSGALTCEYDLEVPVGVKVKLTVNDLNTNLCCDELSLYDGSASKTPFAVLSGKVAPGTIYTTPTSNILRMTYSATDGISVRGWSITFGPA